MTEQTNDPLADVLAAHWPAQSYTHNICSCGKHTARRDEGFGPWAAHVAAVIHASGAGLGGATREQIARALYESARTPGDSSAWEGLHRPEALAYWRKQADAVLALRPDPAPDDTTPITDREALALYQARRAADPAPHSWGARHDRDQA